MGKISVLIGGLIMLFAHTLTYLKIDAAGTEITATNIFGFFLWLYFSSSESSEFYAFNGNWLNDNSVYEFLFGNALFGLVILVVVVLAVVLAFAKDGNSLPGLLLIVAGVLLLAFRFIELNDIDSFFYDSDGGRIYIEIPFGFIAGLVAGLMNLKSS